MTSTVATKSVQLLKPITIEVLDEYQGPYSHTEKQYSFKNICDVEMNTIRRTMFEHIPCFAYHPNYIKISNKNTVFHKDHIKLTISNIPVPVDLNDRSTMQYFKYDDKIVIGDNATKNQDTAWTENTDTDGYDEDQGGVEGFSDNEEENAGHYNSEPNNISMYFEKENTSNKIIDVTTDDCTFYYKGKRIDNFYATPLSLIKLQPEHTIRCLAVTKIGTPKVHDIWSSVIISEWVDKAPDHFVISLESMGQLSENEIVYRACTIICLLMDYFEEYLETNASSIVETELNKGVIRIKDKTIGNATVGNLVNYHLQNHDDIVFCGSRNPLLESIFEIEYVTSGKKTIVQILQKVVLLIKDRFTNLANKVDNL